MKDEIKALNNLLDSYRKNGGDLSNLINSLSAGSSALVSGTYLYTHPPGIQAADGNGNYVPGYDTILPFTLNSFISPSLFTLAGMLTGVNVQSTRSKVKKIIYAGIHIGSLISSWLLKSQNFFKYGDIDEGILRRDYTKQDLVAAFDLLTQYLIFKKERQIKKSDIDKLYREALNVADEDDKTFIIANRYYKSIYDKIDTALLYERIDEKERDKIIKDIKELDKEKVDDIKNLLNQLPFDDDFLKNIDTCDDETIKKFYESVVSDIPLMKDSKLYNLCISAAKEIEKKNYAAAFTPKKGFFKGLKAKLIYNKVKDQVSNVDNYIKDLVEDIKGVMKNANTP